jgi:hypothetical protein
LGHCLMPNHVHLGSNDDNLVSVEPMLEKCPNWLQYLGPSDRLYKYMVCRRARSETPRCILQPLPLVSLWAAICALHGSVSDSRRDALYLIRDLIKVSLGQRHSREMLRGIKKHTQTGRPLGSENFIESPETLTHRSLKLRTPGRKTIK